MAYKTNYERLESKKQKLQNYLANNNCDDFVSEILQEMIVLCDIQMSEIEKKSKVVVEKTNENKQPKNIKFDDVYPLLYRYKMLNGNLNVPANFVTETGFPLGVAVEDIRIYDKTHKYGIKFNKSERKMLESIGFIWDVQDYEFVDFLNHFFEYKQNFKDVFVKTKYISPDGYPLGKKVAEFRNRTDITLMQAQMLKSSGFVWDGRTTPNNIRFERCYHFYQQYKREYGDLFMPFDYEYLGCSLGEISRRILLGNEFENVGIELSQEKKDQLTALGFSWDMREWEFHQHSAAKRVAEHQEFNKMLATDPALIGFRAMFGDNSENIILKENLYIR